MAECSICYGNIDATTGSTILSCSHSFHFSCIAKWFTKQETCPCCRKEMGDTEVLPENSPDAASDSDDSDESVEEAEFTREELDAFLRRHGGSLSDAMAQAVCSEYAGFTYMELRMLVLGNTGHDLTEEEWNELIEEEEDDAEGSEAEGSEENGVPETSGFLSGFTNATTDLDAVNARILEYYLSYPHMEMALVNDVESKRAAAKIQHAWRKYSIRKDALILYNFSNV